MVLSVNHAYSQPVSSGSGSEYPNRPVRMVTTAPGGGNDFAARLIAPALAGGLGQQVIVDNRSSTVVPGDIVAKSPPDGYSILLAASTFTIGPLLIRNSPYDPVQDFAPITLAVSSPNILVVHPMVPATSIKELIALARSKPGELNYATSGIGSSAHLAAELFKSMAGVNIVHVPYKGAGPASIDLVAGQVQLAFGNTTTVMPHVKAGRLRALAVSTAQPSALVPGLPTVASSGLTGFESASMVGILGPARTPSAIVERLNRELVRVLNLPDVKEKFSNVGMETVGSTPAHLNATMKSEIARLGKVIRDAGIRGD